MTATDAAGLAAGVRLEEAASLLSGADMERTKPLTQHGIPSIRMTDGSNGVAMNLPNFAGKVPATCFPTLSAMAASWHPDLVARVARAIALEARAAGAQVLLSPGMNIKRSPLGGRNFEYFSEDPHLTGTLATAFVTGVQSTGVGACVKHYAVNNQETDRMRVSADVDPRALREIYLAAFEQVVTVAKPWLVMASYNRVNGVYATQHPQLLEGILRGEWGFEGVVVSDWGAVDDRVAALRAGLDLEMPSTGGASDAIVLDAVRRGEIDAAEVHRSASRVVALAAAADAAATAEPGEPENADALAIEAAEHAAVLLRNRGDVLPLARGSSIALIGAFAREPRFQGGGSAGVNVRSVPTSLVTELAALHDGTVTTSDGYLADGESTTAELVEEAVSAAAEAAIAVVVVGLPDAAESEGYDRTSLRLPPAQTAVIESVSAVAAHTVVIVIAGGVVTMEGWREQVDAILWPGLAGQGVSAALARVLVGASGPSGRLAETIPLSAEDAPSHPTFPGSDGHSLYGESIFVGYRGYDELRREVAFPFGHGLSYSRFAYSNPSVARANDEIHWCIDVENVGGVSSRDIVQLYLSAPGLEARRSNVELVGFDSAYLAPGETRTLSGRVPARALAFWREGIGWSTEPGRYALSFARSSRDVIARVNVDVEGAQDRRPLTSESTLSEWLDDPRAGSLLLERVAAADEVGSTIGLLTNPMARLMIGAIPIKRLTVDAGNVLTSEMLAGVARDLDA